MIKNQPRWVIAIIIAAFSGFSFLVLFNLSKSYAGAS